MTRWRTQGRFRGFRPDSTSCSSNFLWRILPLKNPFRIQGMCSTEPSITSCAGRKHGDRYRALQLSPLWRLDNPASFYHHQHSTYHKKGKPLFALESLCTFRALSKGRLCMRSPVRNPNLGPHHCILLRVYFSPSYPRFNLEPRAGRPQAC